MRKREKTQAELLRANRGNVPGVMGMAEYAVLTGRPHFVGPGAPRHGHVTPNENGVKAKCGGPALCSVCAMEKAALDAYNDCVARIREQP